MVTVNCSNVYWDIWRPKLAEPFELTTADKDYCRYSVLGYAGVSHQCTRKPVEDIDDYKFCKQHAKIIRRKLKEFEGLFERRKND